MANYVCTVRSNYFHVNDIDKFKEFIDRAYGAEDDIHLWEKTDANGVPVFGFGGYGEIAGVRNANEDENEDCDESSFDEFIEGLQSFITEDDAAIILEAGNEKMRYVVGSATIVTHNDYKYLDITNLAIKEAGKMLNVKDFATECYY